MTLLSTPAAFAQGEVIETIAGGGPDGLPATSVELFPTGIGADPAGGFYVAGFASNQSTRVFRVDPDGILTLVAGTGVGSPAGVTGGYGGPATGVYLGWVLNMALDPAGNLYLADGYSHTILRVDGASGTMTRVGYSANADVMAVDSAQHIYVSDRYQNFVQRIDASTGEISFFAGSGSEGFSGDGGPATEARLSRPVTLAFDASDNLYIADTGNRRIRKVDAVTGIITTVAGTGSLGFEGDGGPATSANLWLPEDAGLALDDLGNLFIADWVWPYSGSPGTRIRRVDAVTGIIDLYAGAGSATGEGIPAIGAQLGEIWALDVDASGDLLAADAGNRSIAPGYQSRARRVESSTGLLHTVAGGGTLDGEGGPALDAVIANLTGIASAPTGDVYISHGAGNSARVGRVDALTGTLTLAAGGGSGYNGDGIPAVDAWLRTPRGLAVDAAGNLFIADSGNHRVRRVDAVTGIITTYAGNGTVGSSGDGQDATMASLNQPQDVALDAAGNLYIADTRNHKIRVVDPVSGDIDTIAGIGTAGYSGDGGPATMANLRFPRGVAVDAAGNLYVADTNNVRVRRVDAATGIITTLAGDGVAGYGGDGGPASSARLRSAETLDVDLDGDVLIVDGASHRIRKVDMATGIIDTVAGTGDAGFGGDGGVPALARLAGPFGITVEASGSYVIGDNLRLRRVSQTSAPTEAGEIEDGNPSTETPLSIAAAPYGMITLSWGPSCYASDTDFEVYEGTMGAFAGHAPKSCGTGGATSLTITPAAASAYYLVVPRSYAREGSYGLDGSGLERPVSPSACLAQEIASCP